MKYVVYERVLERIEVEADSEEGAIEAAIQAESGRCFIEVEARWAEEA